MADIKVNGVGAGRGATPPRKTKKTGNSGGSFSQTLKEAAETHESGASSGVSGVTSITSIIAAQEVSDSMEERSRGLMMAYGEDLLNRLEDFRLGLLIGAIPKENLADLAHRMREKKQQVKDPVLINIINEIELRAEVEIAKLTR